MTDYRHKRTGAVASAPAGSKRDALMAEDTDNWEAVKAEPKAEPKAKAEPKSQPKASPKG